MKKYIKFIITIFIILSAGLYLNNTDTFAKSTKLNIITNAAKDKKIKVTNLSPKYDKSSGLYGYVDAKDKWVIKPKFMKARPFSQGLAAVLEDSEAPKWGYILPDGTFAIKPVYSAAYEFMDDFAIVTDDKFYIVMIDIKGKVIKQTKYHIAQMDLGYIRATISDKEMSTGSDNTKYGVITKTGAIIKPQFDGLPNYIEPFVTFFKEDASKDPMKRTYYVLQNKDTMKLPGAIISVSEGIGIIEYESDKYKGRPKLYAYLTSKCNLIMGYGTENNVKYPFVEAKGFSEGYAAIAINYKDGSKVDDRWGFIAEDATQLIKPVYLNADSFHNGVAPVKSDESWGYIKTDLTWFIKLYEFTEEQLKKEKENTINEAKSILKKITNTSMTDYEKLDSIYEYVINEIDYDSANDDNNNIPRASYTAYGALKYKVAVGEGFTEALHIMLDLSGIENMIISGTYKNLGTEHIWNLVKISGKYYHIDATADSSNPSRRNSFMLTDDKISGWLDWDKDAYPAANTNYK